jgi:hypothetical protein
MISAAPAFGREDPPTATELDALTVLGRREDLVGRALSASEGRVGREDMNARPFARTGDLLEFVPGLVATQHSGSGKANQYFLRGFNLDHGTDFATFVDAMPVNLRTHGHGQGYTDLNFLIPELVQELEYRKGPYYADIGDFSSAGSARFDIADRLPRGTAEFTLGEHGYQRGLLADSLELGTADLLLGAEALRNDGPWSDIDENVQRANFLLRASGEAGAGRVHGMLMAYDNTWNSPDQIPQRAVEQGLIDDLGSLDTTLGGESSRWSVSGGWQGAAFGGDFSAQAYLIDYDFRLWSNFTYFLDDPIDGDQFEQFDERRTTGGAATQQWEHGRHRWRIGAELRRDDIAAVGLRRTAARRTLSTVREDAVDERSAGVFVAHEFRFSDALRSSLGLRRDDYSFRVDAGDPRNGGRADDAATSAKAALIWAPWAPLELYASYGDGFHSNDARGTTIAFDPASGEPAEPVDPLVASRGTELGARLFLSERVHATAALWRLDLDSELLFVGDAGTTEASRPSSREGLELGVYWFGDERWSGDLEVSWTDARFDDPDPAGREIPGAIPFVLSAGLTARLPGDWFANARVRHFSGYPLIEDDSRESADSTLLNLRLGREWKAWGVYLDVLNALDSSDHDIDYFYASRLPGEPGEGVEDLHFHSFEPRTARLSVRWSF